MRSARVARRRGQHGSKRPPFKHPRISHVTLKSISLSLQEELLPSQKDDKHSGRKMVNFARSIDRVYLRLSTLLSTQQYTVHYRTDDYLSRVWRSYVMEATLLATGRFKKMARRLGQHGGPRKLEIERPPLFAATQYRYCVHHGAVCRALCHSGTITCLAGPESERLCCCVRWG